MSSLPSAVIRRQYHEVAPLVVSKNEACLMMLRLGSSIISEKYMILCRKGMDLYFKRHDGQAVTCDDFRNAMADANDKDLSSFAAWCAIFSFISLHPVAHWIL